MVLYWVIFIIAPFIFATNINESSQLYNYVTAFFIFILVVSPFFFILPYKLSKLASARQRVLYVAIGLIVPYIAIYIDAIYALTHMSVGLF